MNKTNLLTLLLAAALLIVTVRAALFRMESKEEEKMTTSNSELIIEAIKARTSIRSYQNKKIEQEKITEILKAAMSAPSARNRQPWLFIVIDDKAVLKELGDALPNAAMTASAPLAIAVCGDLSKTLEGESSEYWIQDTSAATENLLLAASAMGLGAVWTGVYPDKGRIGTLRKILNIPENIIPLNLIPIGYPEGSSKPKNKWDEANIHKNRW